MKQSYLLEIGQKIFLLIVFTILTLVVAEGILQIVKTNQFFIRKPNRTYLLKPNSRYLPGISGPTRFTVNRLGLRGDELRDQEIRILTIGGSTTECGYLDDAEAWPHLLQEGLKQKTGRSVWVGNAGVSGHNARHNIVQLAKLLDQISDIDLVIALIGANELNMSLRSDYNPLGLDDPAVMKKYLQQSFEVIPRKIRNYRGLELYKLIRSFFKEKPYLNCRILGRDLSKDYSYQEYENGSWLMDLRLKRRRAKKVSLPKGKEASLLIGFDEYRRNIKTLHDLGQKHGVKVLFLTQPDLTLSQLSETEEDLMQGGSLKTIIPGSDEYLLVSEVRRGQNLLNQVLLKTGEDNNLTVMNLSLLISPHHDSFYGGGGGEGGPCRHSLYL